MRSDAHDPHTPANGILSRTRLLWRGIGEFFAFARSAIVAVRDLWVAAPPEPPVHKGEDCDAP